MLHKFILCLILLFNALSQNKKSIIDEVNFKDYSQVKLEKKLREISGLAVDKKGNVFAHNDENGTIFQIDPRTGETIKYFKIGRFFTPYNEDFEGIAIAHGYFYMITGKGLLYEFKEGKHKESVSYKTYDLGLSSKFNFEGLCYDPKDHALMMIAKDNIEKKYPNKRAIFSFSLRDKKVDENPSILISRNELKELSEENKFSPSGIEFECISDHFLIVAAKGNLLVEIDRQGNIINTKNLGLDLHCQPEGITFLNKEYLLISDEHKRFGRITLYPFK